MQIPVLALCAISGILPLLGLAQLPTLTTTGVLTVLASSLALYSRRYRLIGLVLLFFCWGLFSAHQTVLPAAIWSGKSVRANVLLTSTDGESTHYGKITQIDNRLLFPAVGIVLYGTVLPQTPCAGQHWQMRINVRAVHGQLNEGTFDRQRHAISQNLPLTGFFTKAKVLNADCSWRAKIVASVAKGMNAFPWQQMMVALAVGERATVSTEVRMILQKTGTSHLMAISGLHISLVALLGWGLLRAIQYILPPGWINWQMPLVGAFLGALLYAWLSGFQPPAQRTIIASAVWLMLRLTGRHWKSWEVWLCCVAAIVVADPLAILSQSLWLSAFAVAALIFWYQWGPGHYLQRGWFINTLYGLLHVQCGLLFLLAALQIPLFHGFSWTSLPANLPAVPLVTLFEVPLLLAGIILHFFGLPLLAQGIWYLADRLLAGLFWFLHWLPDGWVMLDSRWQGLTLLPWLGLLLWRLNGWFRWPAMWLSVCVLTTFPLWSREDKKAWSLTMLDVGQGLAVVIVRNGKAVLYDTGPAWSGSDSAQQVIIPWLHWHHLTPDGVILSHEHLDHRGGLDSLLTAWPAMWVRSPLQWKGHRSCFRGDVWYWEGLTFRVLWPLAGSSEKGNNRSCVVRVDDGKHSALLTGDIEIPAEMLMLRRYWQHLASTLVQVPHHGSSTSSSVPLLRGIDGEIALASASRYNSWHLPSWKVKQRYKQLGYQWFDTPHQGQITVTFTAGGWQIRRLREQIIPRWYHQWFGDTHDNG